MPIVARAPPHKLCPVDRKFTTLIVEPNPDYVFLLERALKTAGIPNPLQVVHDGEQALEYLHGSGQYGDRLKFPFPSLIFTEIKIPRKGGFEILQWLRNNPQCSVIPIIILTASKLQSDIKRAYELGVNSYMVKPASNEELAKMMKITHDYWLICEKPEYPVHC
jgi:CheY-like chemotaxis protein